MALFNFDFDYAKRRQEREAAERLRQARERFGETLAAGRDLPRAPSPFLGVSPELTDADLEALVRNEEAAKAAGAARGDYETQLVDAMIGLREAGIDPSSIMATRDTELRRGAVEDLYRGGQLSPHAYVDALGGKEVSPFRFSANGVGNRYTGDYTQTDAGSALTEKRRLEGLAAEARAGNSDALADYNRARAGGEQFRNQVIEDILSEPNNPLVAADIVNKRAVAKPQRVKVNRRDGSQVYYDAVPNIQGGFDYSPAGTAPGDPLVSEPGGDDGTALQQDTRFIADTLGIPANQALLWKLQAVRKAPQEAWADLISRLTTARKYDPPEKIRERAEQLWAIARPGEPVPSAATAGGQGGGLDPAGDEEQDAVRRAEAEGYSNFGRYIPGKGLEILDESGAVIGHYY